MKGKKSGLIIPFVLSPLFSPALCFIINDPAYAEKIKRVRSGYCCVASKINASNEAQCKKDEGIFFASQAAAKKGCKTLPTTKPTIRIKSHQSSQGFCCDKGHISQSTKARCDKNRGDFSVTRSELDRACKSTIPPAKQEKYDSQPRRKASEITRTTTIRTTTLPDLEVTKTWLNRKCVMQNDIRNNGGPITDRNFARMHISADPNNSISVAKGYLKYADPKRKLQKTRGHATYNSKLIITDNAQSLVLINTEHTIKESNELNNSSDKKLFCRTPFNQKDMEPIVKKTNKNIFLPYIYSIRLIQKDKYITGLPVRRLS